MKKISIEKSRAVWKEFTEKGQLGMQSTHYRTSGCDCHRTLNNYITGYVRILEICKPRENKREREITYIESLRGRLAQNRFFLGSQNLQRFSILAVFLTHTRLSSTLIWITPVEPRVVPGWVCEPVREN